MLKSKGQHLAELALCLAVVIGVLLSMQRYVQRSLQAKYKSGADYLFRDIKQAGAGHLANPRQQYDPYYASSNMTQTHGSGMNAPAGWGRADGDDIDAKFLNGTQHIDKISGRSGWQQLGPAEDAN
ncbi:MAG: hypothetical protein NT066_05890 [Candidatus Omnitrophica bacterium]|nr:hypothetical protein [Candidatus Omnitrophota bacterium]